MCTDVRTPEMAGLHAGHLSRLMGANPDMTELTTDIFRALTKNLNPHLPALAAFMAMAEAVERNDYGVLGAYRLVRLPLSIIGTDKARYRTPTVDRLHETVLSMRMSELTVETLRGALRPHGLCVMFLCSCGVVMGRCADVRAYYGSKAHMRMDRLRSAIDAEGNPIVSVDTFADIEVSTMDLHYSGAEERLFARVAELTGLAAAAGYRDYDWLDGELSDFVRTAEGRRPPVLL